MLSRFLSLTLNTNHQRNLSSRFVGMASGLQNPPIESSIKKKLVYNFEPHHLEIINESYMHNVPRGSETHFKVVVVSSKFENLPLIRRHRLVNDLLHDELKNGVHALSIIAKTPQQWNESNQTVEKSPACRGGFGQ